MSSLLQRYPKRPRPLGESVVDVILRDAPAIFPFVPEAWIEAKQARRDAIASNAEVDTRHDRAVGAWHAQYPTLDPRGFGPMKDKLDKIDADYVPDVRDVDDAEIPAAQLLDAVDILAPQPYNRVIEDRFRRALFAKLLTKPITVTLSSQWGVILGWGDTVIRHTKGRIAFDDLMRTPKFAEAYSNDVTHAPELQELRGGMAQVGQLIDEVSAEHRERMGKDADHPGVAWTARQLGGPDISDVMTVVADAQAHPEKGTLEERLEELKAPRPDLSEWDAPLAALNRSRELLQAGQFELALWAYGEAERGALRVAGRVERYEAKVMKGAGVAVKWLQRAKFAGKLAVGVISGGGSLLVQAGAAAGYSLLQEGGQQMSEVAYGLRGGLDVGGLLKQAGLEGATAFLGGATQGSFQRALTARFGTVLTERYGPALAQRFISGGAAMTSAFYTAPANRVLARILAGQPPPKSLEELANLIVDDALSNVVMDVAFSIAGHGAAPEEPSGAAAHTAPDVATGPNKAMVSDAPRPPHLLELAGQAARGEQQAMPQLLDSLGPWEDAMWHLRRGTGPAAGLDEALRRTLMERLRDHRGRLAEAIRAQFGAEPAGTPSAEWESDLDLNVRGENAGTQAVRIKGYLDSTHPGWERRYRMAVMVDAARTGHISDAIAHLPDAARHGLVQRQALYAEAIQLMREARAVADPAQRKQVLDRIGEPKLRESAELYAGFDAATTRQMHDRLLADTDRKLAAMNAAPGDAHAVEEALVAQMWANALDPEAYVSPATIGTIVQGGQLGQQGAYEAVIDQVAMIQHQAGEAGGMRGALRRYETFKYIKRICDHLRATGVHDPRVELLRNQAELVYNVQRRAAASAGEHVVGPEDLTSTAAHREVAYDDFGPTPGVSDAVLADTYAMLDALLAEQLPQLRRIATGTEGSPVRLPALGPEPPPQAAAVHSGPAEHGLAAPEALERIALFKPGQAGATLQERALMYLTPIQGELAALGTKPPTVAAVDFHDPAALGRYDPVANVILINEGAMLNGKPYYDGTPLGIRRLRSSLLHESRHAEQYFQALRHRALSEHDPAKLAHETGVDRDVIDAALRQPPLEAQSREGAAAKQYYEEYFGRHHDRMLFGQDTKKWGELAKRIRQAETDAHVAQTLLGRIKWYEVWKLLDKSRQRAKLAKAQADITKLTLELEDRMQTYATLLHEQDAVKAERLAAQALGARELAIAGQHYADARAELEFLRQAMPEGEHHDAMETLANALQTYADTLETVGASYRELGIKSPPKERP